MKLIKTLKISVLSEATGIDYYRLRTNLMARPDDVTLTDEERIALVKAAENAVWDLKNFLKVSHE